MEGADPGERSLQVARMKSPFGEAAVQLDFDRRGRLEAVLIRPVEPLSRDDLQKIVGPLESRRYEFASCPEDSDSGPLVERADGQFEYLVAPSRGLSASMQGETVAWIELALGPPDRGTCQ
jgi:hypothetical protein